MLAWHDAVHKSNNDLYEMPKPIPCNVCIKPANDPNIVWEYEEGGPRQSARPYLRTPQTPERTQYARISHNGYATPIHPEMARALIENRPGIPGDIIARCAVYT